MERGEGGSVGPNAHGNAARHVGDGLNAEGGREWAANTVKRPLTTTSTTPSAPTTGPR